MRKIFTLMLLMYSASTYSQTPKLSNALSGKIAGLTVYSEPNPNTRVVFRCRSTSITDTPLLIVDGVVNDFCRYNGLKPDDIESITILKDAAASAIYGYRASNGVTIITSKSSKLRKFIIKDFLEGKTIPGATVKFKSQKDKNDSLVIAANDSGFILTNKLNPGIDYDIEVSSVGFKNYSSCYKNPSSYTEQVVFLEQKINTLKEVIIAPGTKCGFCRYRCGTSCRTTISYNSIIDTTKQNPSFKVYPNPVNSGASINLELPADLSANFIVRIFSLSGATVFQQKFSGVKTNTINLLLNSRLSASEYIVQLVSENGKAAGQQKIIIQ